MDYFDFPPELIPLVLQHVERRSLFHCALVNTMFYKEALPLLWQRLDIDSNEILSDITHLMATSSGSLGLHVRKVSISSLFTSTALLAFIQHVPYLEHLTLDKAGEFSDDSFQYIPQQCPHLMTLDVSYGHFTRISIQALSQHCHQLETVRLNLCTIVDHDFPSTLLGCPVKKVDLTPVFFDTYMTNNTMALGLARFTELVDIRINGMLNDSSYFITAVLSHGIAWSHLTHLSITSCVETDDTAAIAFLTAHPRLEFLEWGHSNITNRTLDAIATHLPNITYLKFQGSIGISASGIYRLLKNLTALNGVYCARCNIHGTDDDFPVNLPSGSYTVSGTDKEVTWIGNGNITLEGMDQHQYQL